MPLVEKPEKVDSAITPPAERSQRSLSIRTIAFPIVGVVALIGAYLWWQYASSIEATDDSYVTGHVHQLSARVAGTVLSLAVKDNQHVDAGQLLIQIDPRDLKIQADVAKAKLAKAQRQELEAGSTIVTNTRQAAAQEFQAVSSIASAAAVLNRAKASLSEAKSGVLVAKSQIQQRQAELTRAASDFDRYQALLGDRAVTTQIFERSKQDKQVAEANLETANENYKQAQSKVEEARQNLLDAQATVIRAQGATETAKAASSQTETSKQTLSVQQAALQQADAEYEDALTQLSYTRLVAPISGHIGHRTVEVGQQIERGQALMSIISDEKWVVSNFKETQLAKMRVGQTVDIHIDAFPNQQFHGVVDSFSPASGAQFTLLPPDNASGNFTKVVQRVSVKIVFDRKSIKSVEDMLTPGMSVTTTVHVTR